MTSMVTTEYFLSLIQGCAHGIGISHGLYPSLFFAGLVGGFTHCTFMCGPFVIAQTGELHKPALRNMMPYHLGRIVTYVVLAILFSGILGITFAFFPIKQLIAAPLLMLAALVFIVNAVPKLTLVFPWVVSLRLPVSERLIKRLYTPLGKTGLRTNYQKFAMGLVLGLMPCGLVLSALIAASTTHNPLSAAAAMSAFGIGTMPALLLTAYSGLSIKNKYPSVFKHVTTAFLIWNSLFLFFIAGTLLT